MMTQTNRPQPLIFTDLDGSLLDHYTYEYEPARELLGQLERLNVPVIMNTSKTRAELLAFRDTINNQHPFIIENGAAIVIPDGYFKQVPKGVLKKENFWIKAFCPDTSHWQQLVHQLKAKFEHCFVGFSELNIEQIQDLTGLSAEGAMAASQREFGEPVHWLGTEVQKQQFIDAASESGAHVLAGGRFLHISGNVDKGKALNWLAEHYQTELGPCCTVAIGDSNNDIAMLNQADYALVIRSPVHSAPTLSPRGQVLYSEALGPTGWVEGVTSILQTLGFTTAK